MDRGELARVFYGAGNLPAPWATDCPVRFDVWLAYAQPPASPRPDAVDLLLAINEEHGARKVFQQLTAAQVAQPEHIAAGAFVVAKLTFDEFIRAILPMTRLYGVVRQCQRMGFQALYQAVQAPSILRVQPSRRTTKAEAASAICTSSGF